MQIETSHFFNSKVILNTQGKQMDIDVHRTVVIISAQDFAGSYGLALDWGRAMLSDHRGRVLIY